MKNFDPVWELWGKGRLFHNHPERMKLAHKIYPSRQLFGLTEEGKCVLCGAKPTKREVRRLTINYLKREVTI
jgi:hypothetical protein